MENDTIVSGDKKTVTVVVSRRVPPGREKDYDDWARRLVAAAAEAPGNTGVTTLIPSPGKTGLHHVVLRFADRESVHRWEDSYVRQKLTHEADAFSVRYRQEATGLETWFSIPDVPGLETPPRWKMAIVTFIAVYVLSVVIVRGLDILFTGANFYLMNILVSALLVVVMTYAVMPWFSRVVFRRWLWR